MAIRTCRIMGVAFGDPTNPVTMTVDFAGTRVFSGAVPTRSGPVSRVRWDQHDILCNWDTNVNLGDTVPVSISLSNGDALVSSLVMNNRSDKTQAAFYNNVTWPAHRPENVEELLQDLTDLGKSQFEIRYGIPVSTLDQYIEISVVVPTQENFQSFPRKAHTNIKLNGDPAEKNPSTEAYKNLKSFPHYQLISGDTLSYDLMLVNQVE